MTRWVFVATGAFAAWALVGTNAFADTPAVLWLHQLLPFPVMAAGFALYAALAAWPRRRSFEAACVLGMGIFASYAAAALVVVWQGFPGSAVVFAALADVMVQHYAALRLAMFDRTGR